MEIEREKIKSAWVALCQQYSVPKQLYKHQVDTILLLLGGDHVFCGSPTGSGKTLPQLATVLFTSGGFEWFNILTSKYFYFRLCPHHSSTTDY
jgi:hypothetical protein